MTDNINVVELSPSVVILGAITWTPAGTFTHTAPGGLVVTAPSAAHGVSLAFAVTFRIDDQGNDFSGPLTITEYRWDFGDGVIGYGNPVTHIYRVANFQTQASVRLTDSKGRRWFTRAQMYLT